jgi:hypothetical protein
MGQLRAIGKGAPSSVSTRCNKLSLSAASAWQELLSPPSAAARQFASDANVQALCHRACDNSQQHLTNVSEAENADEPRGGVADMQFTTLQQTPTVHTVTAAAAMRTARPREVAPAANGYVVGCRRS